MTRKNIEKSIRQSSDLLSELNILNACVNTSLLSVNDNFMKISFNEKSRYEEIYLTGLEQQNYNLILDDYSYFQFNFSEKEDSGNGYNTPYARYAFYPNPFEKNDESLDEIYKWYKDDEINFEEYSQAISEYNPLFKRVPIRYDLSFKQFRQIYHPAAHFHFALAENSRIATNKIFTPLSFTMMILNIYYLDKWTIYNDNKSDFYLDKKFRNEIDKSPSIDSFGSTYFCTLQDNLLCIK